MTMSRRQFVNTALAAGAALAAGSPALARTRPGGSAVPAERPSGSLRILILGGTSFLGPALTDAAIARGHHVTHFNRGRLEARREKAGRPSQVPDGVEEIFGNRDPNLTADAWKDDPRQNPDKIEKDPNSPKGLSGLEGKKWDAVLDTSGYWPRIVKASADLFAPNVRQYLFISSISVYKRNDVPNADESAELATLSDPNTEDFGPGFSNYGGGKAACEAAAEAAMRGRVANVRPGYIVGPRDMSRRFCYWPVRISRGGPTVVPGKPTDPIQIIDVRDLAEWCIHLVEDNINGVFNATGPDKELSMRAFVEGCKNGVGGDSEFHWLDPEFLTSNAYGPEHFPLWIAPEGETSGFHRCNVSKAINAGLTFRPVSDTSKATLDWINSLPADGQKGVTPEMDLEREKQLIEAWNRQNG